MNHRRMGGTGLKVSEICLGTMTFGVQCDEKASFAILDRAVDAGVDFFDTADVYPVPMTPESAGRTEEILGHWLHGRRDRFVVATKCFFPMGASPRDRGNSRHHVLGSLESSLRRLRTDYVDLYQVHAHDHETPLEETLRALDDATRAGKVRYAGCSNFLAFELAQAALAAGRLGVEGFRCVQPRYNALHRDAELDLLPLAAALGVGVIVFNPLAGGLLTGRHRPGASPEKGSRFSEEMGSTGSTYRRRYWQDESLQAIAALDAFFQQRGRSLATAAVAFALRRPELTAAIVGASRIEQLDATLAASGFVLAEDELQALDELWYRLPRQRPAIGPVR